MTLSVDAVAGYAYATGLRGEALVTAVAIAGPESGYDERAFAGPPKYPRDQSYGLWQINMLGDLGPARRKQFGLKNNEQLYDPATNARAMYAISSGGTNWKPWSAFNSGKHRAYLDRARAAAQAVEGRAGASAAAGQPLLEATALGPIAGERIPPGGGLRDVPAYPTRFPALGVAAGGLYQDLAQIHGIGGTVSLSASNIDEIDLEFINARNTGIWQTFLTLHSVRMGDFAGVVAASGWGERDGVEVFTVTVRPAAVDQLRQPTQGAIWNNLSPTEVLAQRAAEVGLRFYGKGTPQRPQITRLSADEAGRALAESDWEMGQRLAREEGFWFFVTGGALYFAPPTWLAEHGTRFPVRHLRIGPERVWNTQGWPQVRRTVDEAKSLTTFVHSVTLPLPRTRGQQVRPGMVVDFNGVPAYDAKSIPKGLIVTDVSWDLDSGDTPVIVEAVEPIDPTPEPPEAAPAVSHDSTGTTVSSGPAAGAGKGGNVSNGGKGTYGYQYEPPGTVAATGTQPGVKVLMTHLLKKFTGSKNSGTFVDRNVDGTNKKSVHAEGRAGDSGVPVSSQYGTSLANYLVANASLFGIQYVIWNGRQWHATLYHPPRWQTYTAPNGKTDNTSMHRDHVHWELCWEAARYLNDRAISAAVGNQ